jgi:hypothetical protein
MSLHCAEPAGTLKMCLNLFPEYSRPDRRRRERVVGRHRRLWPRHQNTKAGNETSSGYLTP